MEKLNPEKLTTTFRGISPTYPIIPRRYTLTHSDTTGELFLTIGPEIAFDKITSMRDEVLAEWCITDDGYTLHGYVQVDIQLGNKPISSARYRIFLREMSLALEAIRFGDRILFRQHPPLDHAPILIHFKSIYPEFCRIVYFGIPEDYSPYSL